MVMSFYKYTRNKYLGDSLNNFVCEESIWIIFIYASISIKVEYYNLLKNTKEWEEWTPIPIFPIDSYEAFTLLYLHSYKFILHIKHFLTNFYILFTIYWILYLTIELFLVGSMSVLRDKFITSDTAHLP